MVVFDTTTLLLAIDPKAKPPNDPEGNVVTRCKERVEFLLKNLHASGTTILIPTPVLAEYLIGVGENKNDFLEKLVRSKNFELPAFDIRAALDLSMLVDPDMQSGKKLDAIVTKAKLKFDKQIVSIAKSRMADRIYTDDGPLATCAKRNGIATVMTWEIPLPPEPPQGSLLLDEPARA